MRDVKITMLGGFSVSVNGKIIDEKSRRSRNLWTLLEYICAFHGKEIPQSELIDLLYDDSANPASALKTQMCRVREVLDELDESCGKEMIVNCAGGYAWNDRLECSFDTDEFERLCKTAFRSSEHFESRIKLIWQAIDIYKGDFLPSLSAEPWAVPILSYYHSMYIKAIYLAIDLLTDNDRQRDIITICQRALLIDQYDEYIHSSYVKALAELGDKKGAREQYLNAIDVFYNKLGVNPSEDFLELYKQTVYACQDTVLELDDISNMLNEDSDAIGAFYCEYEFFKHIFKLEKYSTEIVDLYNELRRIVFDSVSSEPQETLWAKLPSYYVGECFVRLIPFKDHINVEAKAILGNAELLSGYKLTPKGMLQIFLKQDIPADALKRIFAETLS